MNELDVQGSLGYSKTLHSELRCQSCDMFRWTTPKFFVQGRSEQGAQVMLSDLQLDKNVYRIWKISTEPKIDNFYR